jgi:hypothetical protein
VISVAAVLVLPRAAIWGPLVVLKLLHRPRFVRLR